MKIKKKCIAMLLAGGQGSRLYALTQKMAKPAIPYGGKNRFIDFPLSNCINSGIDTVGVLTQYQPLVLNEYIGNGQPWDLDKMHGGVHVLPPPMQFIRIWHSLNAMIRNMFLFWAVTIFIRWITPKCWIIILPIRQTAPLLFWMYHVRKLLGLVS